MEPHLLNVSNIVKKLNSSLDKGLTSDQAQLLQEEHGPNKLRQAKLKGFFYFIFRELYQSKIILFSACALIAGFCGHEFAALFGTMLIVFQALFNALVQRKAYRQLRKVNERINFECHVIRDGKKQLIKVEQLVPGDLLILEVGQRVPADARIVQAEELYVNESMLTECITPVEKQSDIVEDEARLADRSNMIYKGTWILSGHGKAIVVAIGANTAIAPLMRFYKEKSFNLPFGSSIDTCSRSLFSLVSWLAVACVASSSFLRLAIPDWYLPLIGWSISFFPRGLNALWQRKVARTIAMNCNENIFIQDQSALQNLGKVSVILVDIIDMNKNDDIRSLIKQARNKGIKIVLMSDRQMNAILPFAQDLGIYIENDRILDIAHCGYIADEELMRLIDTTTVYAQMNELNKIRIIKLFNKLGKVVAATGQTLADIPVLEAADIGIARPQAADMVKEKADMILLDSSFSLILLSIKHGGSINKRLKWLLISTASIFILFLAGCSIDYFFKTAIVMGNYIYR